MDEQLGELGDDPAPCGIARPVVLDPRVHRRGNGFSVRIQLAFSLKPVSLSGRTPLIRVTAMPADTNPYGGVFGGWLMSQMALAAGSLASRQSRGKAVVVAADELRFPGAPQVGDEISVYADLEKQGRTSMTIAVEAIARERDGEGKFAVASGRFTFVALGADDRPRVIGE